MENYRTAAHTAYDLKYYLEWNCKNNKPILQGSIAHEVRDVIRRVCADLNVIILQGSIKKDRVQLYVSIPPSMSISKFMQIIKGKSGHILLREHQNIKTLIGDHIWAVGYFVKTIENINKS